MRWVALLLTVLSASSSVAGTLLFEGPDAGDGLPFSIYPADEPQSAATAIAMVRETVDLEAGRYVYGLDFYSWRSAPFDVGAEDTVTIPLGALRSTVPDGASATYGLFSTVEGYLLAPFAVPAVLYVPAGDYVLRRDLGELPRPVSAEAGQVTELPMGAIRLSGPPAGAGLRIYFAHAATGGIEASVVGVQALVAMPDGDFMVATSQGAPPVPISVAAGAVTDLQVTLVDWADRSAARGPVELRSGDASVALPPGGHARFALLGTGPLEIATEPGEPRLLDASPGGHALLWRLSDGRIPAVDGLPLDLPPGIIRAVARGQTLPLVTELGGSVSVAIALLQGGRRIEIGAQRMGAGIAEFSVMVPEDLDEAAPVRFEISVPGDLPMTGLTPPLDMHIRLDAAPEALEATGIMPTAIELTWRLVDSTGVKSVVIYRGGDARPLVRLSPESSGFTDIGLSAGRSYAYRVCTYDVLDLAGPCTETTGSTHQR